MAGQTGNQTDPLGNQHGSGAQVPQGEPTVLGGFARQTSPTFGIGGGLDTRGRSGGTRDRSGEPANARRRVASESRAEPLKRSFEEVSGGDAGNFREFFQQMFRVLGSGGQRGAGKNRECGFLDDKRFSHIKKFEGDQAKFRTFLFDFLVGVGRCTVGLASEIKKMYSRGPRGRTRWGGRP